MSTKSTIPPTEEEIALAMDVISRAAKVRKESGELDAELVAFRKRNKRKTDLALECDETAQAVYLLIQSLLPKQYHDLFLQYSILVLGPFSINDHNFSLFKSCNRKAKKLLAGLQTGSRRRSTN